MEKLVENRTGSIRFRTFPEEYEKQYIWTRLIMTKKNNNSEAPGAEKRPEKKSHESEGEASAVHGQQQEPIQPEGQGNHGVEENADTENTRIAELEMELAAAKDKLLRTLADFDNYRKRVQRDIIETRVAVKIDTIIPVLNVFDHFKLALAAAENKADFKVLNGGMKIILSEFDKSMNELGIKTVPAAPGDLFDPNLHEAAGNEASDLDEGKIIRQWRSGYMMGEKLLRPASVIVSSGPASVEAAVSEEKA